MFTENDDLDVTKEEILNILESVSWSVHDLDKVLNNLFNDDILNCLLWSNEED